MPDLGTRGTANVKIQAKLDQLEQGLTAAQSKLRERSAGSVAAQLEKQ
jgi:hypothetical protein